ncbi:hypothetical protein [Streptomyces sp. V4I8]|uniref:hypothetical protein n=1 Tax=Streptomyces sp. V4I8 TaxID=3156469 RepID=UPI0035181EEE
MGSEDGLPKDRHRAQVAADSPEDGHVMPECAGVVLEVQAAEVLQGGDGKGVPAPLLQVAVLTVEPQHHWAASRTA